MKQRLRGKDGSTQIAVAFPACLLTSPGEGEGRSEGMSADVGAGDRAEIDKKATE